MHSWVDIKKTVRHADVLGSRERTFRYIFGRRELLLWSSYWQEWHFYAYRPSLEDAERSIRYAF